jgi:hypothetical protein
MWLAISPETNLGHILTIILGPHQILQIVINNQIIRSLLACGALVLLGQSFSETPVYGKKILKIEGLEMAGTVFGTDGDGDFG